MESEKVFIGFLIILSQLPVYISDVLDSTIFQRTLESLAKDGLGTEEMQEYINGNAFYESHFIDPGSMLDELEDHLADKFEDVSGAVRRLRNVVQNTYAEAPEQPRQGLKQCCGLQEQEFSEIFNTNVNLASMCYLKQEEVQGEKYLGEDVLDVMIENYQNVPFIRWQYFGSEKGMFTNYPAAYFCSETYDPRFRPWYVETATPTPKDIVIIIDKSGSMQDRHHGRTLMDIAKEAAKTVVNTLNPNDRVGIVAFSSDVVLPYDTKIKCLSSQMAVATPQNIEILGRFIDGIQYGGGTKYGIALDEAFDLFDNLPDSNFEERDMAILFLTDGEANDDANIIMDKISQRNAKLNNKVIILTFGLGLELTNSAKGLLDRMAKQDTADLEAGSVTAGEMKHISDPSDLRSAMASYYNYFSDGVELDSVIYSVPYADAFGLGLIMSACLPAYSDRKLIGVACLDIEMAGLILDLTSYHGGSESYVFMVDNTGRTIMHPLLPAPSNVHEQPIFVHIESLERDPKFQDILESIKRGESGSENLQAVYVWPKGNVSHDGVNTKVIYSTYNWKMISGTIFALCLVVRENARMLTITPQTNFLSTFNYHRLDLHTEHDVCNYLNRVATKEASATKFTASAFTFPYGYLSTAESVNDVHKYHAIMTGVVANQNEFKPGVVDTVLVTSELDMIWQKRKANYAIWRYMGTENGVFWIYPGIRMGKQYDHTKRPWYRRAIGELHDLTVSTPYVDASGAGYVVTLSQVIFDNSGQQPIGVMGMDFSLQHFYYLFTQDYTECNEYDTVCFIIDNTGHIIVHSDWFEGTTGSFPKMEYIHIISKEPSLAYELFNSNKMSRHSCVDFEDISENLFWEVNLNEFKSDAKYEIHRVEGTSLFIGIIRGKSSSQNPCTCQIPGSVKECQQMKSSSCECPCYQITNFDHCNNRFTLGRDGSPPCGTDQASVNLDANEIKEEAKLARELPQCFKSNCNKQQGSCVQDVLCSWCKFSSSGVELNSSYCTEVHECYWGTEGRSGPIDVNTGGDNKGDDLTWMIIVGIVVGICLVIAIVIFFHWKKNRKSKTPQRSDNSDSRSMREIVSDSRSMRGIVSDSRGRREYGSDNWAMQMEDQAPLPSAPPSYDDRPPPYSRYDRTEDSYHIKL